MVATGTSEAFNSVWPTTYCPKAEDAYAPVRPWKSCRETVNEFTLASYSMVCPSAEAIRIEDPFGEVASTVFTEGNRFWYTPRLGSLVAWFSVRSIAAR